MITCPHCQAENINERQTCKTCGKDLRATLGRVSSEPLSIDQRTTILEQQIAAGITNGWQLVTRDTTSATMTRKGQANGCLVLILLCIMILPGVLYYLFGRPIETIFIRVDEYGEVFRTKGTSG